MAVAVVVAMVEGGRRRAVVEVAGSRKHLDRSGWVVGLSHLSSWRRARAPP